VHEILSLGLDQAVGFIELTSGFALDGGAADKHVKSVNENFGGRWALKMGYVFWPWLIPLG